ncbi:helix-turn-helix domain-containing protein [Bacillus sp. NPDC077027]|uniref:helix-turn-helix domain-containing protein n=1 Tax=Bacillus sp. NPDC077027 TaxID=3390548 RepID=UPI003D0154DF
MTVFDIVKELCNERKISINDLEKSLGYSKNTLYRLKTQTPGADKLQKIADYFDVSTDYLLGRTEVKKTFDLTEKDEKDIQKELQNIINGLEGNSYAAFDGQILDDMEEEDKELLIASLENTLRIAKKIAKQKYTPKNIDKG